MVIANPIYDVVFKKLMEDKRIAKFFIETLTSETILDIEVKPQEYTYNDRLAGIMLYRLDFIAKIKTGENEYKNVLIEIQKAKHSVDLMRFRNYLAEQYKKEDEVSTPTGKSTTALPIITIYLLGFNLPEVDASVIKVSREYYDLIEKKVIVAKNDFIEKLTHDCYIIQIPRIKPRLQSKLETLLTVFEQANFIDNKEITKNYKYPVNDDSINNIINVLHYAGTNPEEKVELEKELEALRVYDLGMRDMKNKIEKNQIEIAEQAKVIEDTAKVLEEKDKVIEEKDKLMEEQAKALQDSQRELEELKKKLGI